MHMIDILILGVLFVWLALSIRHMHRRRKSAFDLFFICARPLKNKGE